MPERKLVVAGEGPCLRDLQRMAPPNVRVVGHVDAETADDLMGRARGYVYAAIEDFGIAPVEAQAAGTPVIGLGIGGLCETIRPLDAQSPTGVMFGQQSVEALVGAIEQFERVRTMIHPGDCRANALRFSQANFHKQFAAFVDDAVARHGVGRPAAAPVTLAEIA